MTKRKKERPHVPTEQEVLGVHQSNAEKLQALRQRGLGIQFPPKGQMQLECLLDYLFPAGTEERREFEMAFARRMEDIIEAATNEETIEEAKAASARAQLLAGVSGPPPAPLRGGAPIDRLGPRPG